MWDEILKNLPEFPTPILTGMDLDGYPFSIRCTVDPDSTRKRLHIEMHDELPIQQGPASLMCHSHNEALWDLEAFLVRGLLEKDGTGWAFYPEKFVKSGVSSKPVDQMKGLLQARKTAKKYLEKRRLPRPKIPWGEYKALRAEIKGK